MYQTLPNLVLAFHGCSRKTYEKVLYSHEELISSTNDYDWLGNGIYFWENSYARAFEWAQTYKANEDPSVVGAVLDLGFCLNFSDYGCTQVLSMAYDLLKSESIKAETDLPKNSGKDDKPLRRLDCAVIERLHKMNRDLSKPSYDSVRGIFMEGGPIYPGSGILSKSHIQICVRNPNCIKGYFAPKEFHNSYTRI